MRKLLLPALAACSLLAVGVPAASAHKAHTASVNSKLSQARGAIVGLKKTVKALFDNDAGQKHSISTVDGRVTALGATVQTILGGVPAIVNGLTAIQSALSNTTTGLVGLNLIRPQYGAFSGAGVILGGTGQATGGSGPKSNVISNGGIPGVYVVDFGNDVSSRVYSVNPFPPGPGTAVPTAGAVNCSSTGAAALCGAAEGASSDASPNHVAVQFGSGGAAAAAGFSITAIHG